MFRRKMLSNYLKTALRHIQRHRGQSLLNIFGLSAGLACAIVIAQLVRFEFSFDRYHEKSERIYRLATDFHFGNLQGGSATSNHPAGPTLQRDYPEVEKAVRFRPVWGQSLVRSGDRAFMEKHLFFADPTVFDVFSFNLRSGDPVSALAAPYSVVLTADAAANYFGHENPLGKAIHIRNPMHAGLHHPPPFTVTGVMDNVPLNSHFTFSMLLSFETIYQHNEIQRRRWTGDIDNYTYLLLAPNCKPEALVKKLPVLVETHLEPELKEAGADFGLFLQPLTRIHLYSNLMAEVGDQNHIYKVMVLILTAALILTIAGVNFVNLSGARAAGRFREIGIRKALGADRRALILQFMGESVLLAIVSLLIALGLVDLLAPLFQSVLPWRVDLGGIYAPANMAVFLLLTVVMGVAAGCYTTVLLAAVRPGALHKGVAAAGRSRFRDVLVIFQFTGSIALMVVTAIVFRQFEFMCTKALGFDRKRTLVVQIVDDELRSSHASLRRALMGHDGVTGVAFSSHEPGRYARTNVFAPEGFSVREMQRMDAISVDQGFVPTMGIGIAAGRNFSPDRTGGDRQAVLINTAAARKFGWDDALGKTVLELSHDTSAKTVIGVTEDFHQRNLFNPIEPLYMEYNPDRFNYVLIKLREDGISQAMEYIETQWKTIAPSKIFAHWFLEEAYFAHYRPVEQIGKILMGLTLLALLIACLGLYGLTAFTAEARTREIGIRKSFGASRADIFLLLARVLLKWVLAANLLAWPLAYWISRDLLAGFPYRVDVGPGMFIAAGLAALAIALATVSRQALKAADTNPVDALRHE
jgi:putative ABC transport system permease protein